jgi:hypothetical protein
MMGTGSVLNDAVDQTDYGLIPRICDGLFGAIAEARASADSGPQAQEHNEMTVEVRVAADCLKDPAPPLDSRWPRP